MASTDGSIVENVREYYGKTLSKSDDLKTNVCKIARRKQPPHILEALKLVHDDVASRFFGCGLVFPECLTGASVLDLGCGSGRDCYALSKLVGENGHVTGVDMTDELLQVANKYVSWHTEKFGYSKPNVRFVKAFIENLGEVGIEQNSYDIIVSNCVVNLSSDKRVVCREAFNALKPGGEIYFSDMYCNQEIPLHIRNNKVLWGEGIGGALYWKNMIEIAIECGFSSPRLITASEVEIADEDVKKELGSAGYVSATYRLFKLPRNREAECVVTYDGKIEGCQDACLMDHATKFITGEAKEVDSELSTILHSARFNKHFHFSPNNRMTPDADPFKYAKKQVNC
ncbi:arsenite methyltransferase-like [Tubulanus polymorphus]|uniref:arsenite methyltransferase-like n=1 Tax=Tubulanus polymorphus TaxID=672921 RepID=UPI003DA6AC53